jgi:hypothetical protein
MHTVTIIQSREKIHVQRNEKHSQKHTCRDMCTYLEKHIYRDKYAWREKNTHTHTQGQSPLPRNTSMQSYMHAERHAITYNRREIIHAQAHT